MIGLLKVSRNTTFWPIPTCSRMTEPRKCTSAICLVKLESLPALGLREIASVLSASDSMSPDSEPLSFPMSPISTALILTVPEVGGRDADRAFEHVERAD